MFKTKNLTLILIGIMLFSLLLTVVGITLPISRKSDKIEEAGNQSMLSGNAIAIAMGHYSATSLRLLQEYPSESTAYCSLCGLLERMREHYGFQDVYTVTRNNMGYFYVLDSQYVQSGTEGYHPIGSEFSFDLYGNQVKQLIDDIYDGNSTGGFVPKAIQSEDGTFIVSAAPIMDGDKVLTVLCMDISLNDIQFHKLWFINFNYVSWICGILFVLSAGALYYLHYHNHQKKKKTKGIVDISVQEEEK